MLGGAITTVLVREFTDAVNANELNCEMEFAPATAEATGRSAAHAVMHSEKAVSTAAAPQRGATVEHSVTIIPPRPRWALRADRQS